MVLNRMFCIILGALSFSQIACNRTPLPPNMAIANEALNEYCKSENITSASFNEAHVYREAKYDWCVEFITKTNAAQKHVLLLFFKDQRIVERQRTLDRDRDAPCGAPLPHH